MDKKPLVTIITVTFNLIKSGREKYFRQCVKSVRNQSYENVEHIIIDGASNDGTVELIKEYVKKGWIKYISEPDSGIYEAMNKGIKMAKGKYIAFLNSDDFYHNIEAINLSVTAMERASADFSYANFLLLKGNKKEKVYGRLEKFIYTMPFGHPTMFAKLSVIKEGGGFNEKYKVAADYDLIIRIILKDYNGVYIDADITSYRWGGVCCVTDYSDEIAHIYMDNYSVFYKFLSLNQAKKIMYDSMLPSCFTANFREYVKKNKYKNLNTEEVIDSLIKYTNEYGDKNILNDYEKKDGVPVFLSSDNCYAPFVGTTIASIMDHTDSYVNFYILDGGISYDNAVKIKKINELFPNFSIEFIEIDTRKEFKNFPTRLHFSIDMYTRFLIPKLKPELKKVIYSDVDVIFNGNVNELLNEDLDGYSLGAVPYTYGYLHPDRNRKHINEFHERLGLSIKHKYFESGLLLIDVSLWKKNNISETLMEEVKNNCQDNILTPDQDVLNIVFENNYKRLDNKYIVVPSRKRVMQTDFSTRESVEKPFIIHYAGAEKPWNNPKIELSSYFWKYARMTLFYEELIYNFSNINKVTVEKKKYRVIDNLKIALLEFKKKVFFALFSPTLFLKKYLITFAYRRFKYLIRKVYRNFNWNMK